MSRKKSCETFGRGCRARHPPPHVLPGDLRPSGCPVEHVWRWEETRGSVKAAETTVEDLLGDEHINGIYCRQSKLQMLQPFACSGVRVAHLRNIMALQPPFESFGWVGAKVDDDSGGGLRFRIHGGWKGLIGESTRLGLNELDVLRRSVCTVIIVARAPPPAPKYTPLFSHFHLGTPHNKNTRKSR